MKSKKQVKQDIKNLTPKQLNTKYPKVYNSWRGMKQRRNTHGAIIHEDFEEFVSFLSIMGDKPTDQHTLDRVDNKDPEYSPQKVRWATKKQQSNNKSDNVLLTNVEGITHTLSEWAYKTDQNPNTLRKRYARGWNHTEIISGIRDRGIALKLQPFPFDSQKKWENKWLDYALEGGKLPRLEFLKEQLEIKVLIRDVKLEVLTLFLESEYADFEIDHYIEHSKSIVQKSLRKYHTYIKSLNMKQIQKERYKAETYLQKNYPILNQVQEQIQYDLNYKKAFEKRPDTLTKGQFRDYYQKRKPRPKYTVNLAPDVMSETYN